MKKKPLTMKQKIKLFNIGTVIGYVLLIFGIMMEGLASPMLWVSFAMILALSIYRVFAIRCPECDDLIPSHFGILSKSCSKCGWHVDKEDADEPEQEA